MACCLSNSRQSLSGQWNLQKLILKVIHFLSPCMHTTYDATLTKLPLGLDKCCKLIHFVWTFPMMTEESHSLNPLPLLPLSYLLRDGIYRVDMIHASVSQQNPLQTMNKNCLIGQEHQQQVAAQVCVALLLMPVCVNAAVPNFQSQLRDRFTQINMPELPRPFMSVQHHVALTDKMLRHLISIVAH